ncbi:MAG TPA: ferritin family protein [Halobacteria archaeon]|nr:ferritin family protein [Halobacteria archaeon]
MSGLIKTREVIEAAVSIEENGYAFYKSVEGAIDDKDVKDVFSFLAGEENRHIVAFKKIYEWIDDQEDTIIDDEDSSNYIKALAEKNVFTKKDAANDMVKNIKTPFDAINLALNFERDSILFFNEIKSFVSQDNQDLINKLIKEEHDHIVKLHNLENQLKK